MKKLVVFALAIAMIATSAFAGGAKESDGFTIAGIYKMGDAEWFLQEGEASREVIEAAGGTFMYMDAGLDGARYIEMIDIDASVAMNGWRLR